MKQNTITDSLFDHAKSLQDISTTANLYGRLLELQDQAINIQKRINEIHKEIDEVNNGKK
jgi:prefoldin subunit 5